MQHSRASYNIQEKNNQQQQFFYYHRAIYTAQFNRFSRIVVVEKENEAKNDNEVPRNEIIVAGLWHVLLKKFMLSRLWVDY